MTRTKMLKHAKFAAAYSMQPARLAKAITTPVQKITRKNATKLIEAFNRMYRGMFRRVTSNPVTRISVTQPQSPCTGYRWSTHDSGLIAPRDMSTDHLFNTVRMVFNHTVPPAYVIPGCKKWRLKLSLEQRTEALRHLIPELASRRLSASQVKQFSYMQRVAARLLTTSCSLSEPTPVIPYHTAA